MRRTALGLGPFIAGSLLIASAASAQLPGLPQPTPEERAAMAEEQARANKVPDSVGSGPFPAVKEVARSLPNNTIYRPADLSRVEPGSLGLIGWGNGGCSRDGASQRHHLAELASHGYVVIAAGPILSGPGIPTPADGAEPFLSTTAEDVQAGIDWALAENTRPGSAFYGLLDPAKIAVSGFSCGGVQALKLAADPRVAAVIVHNSGLFPADVPQIPGMESDKAWLNALHTPVLYIQGGPSDIAYANGMNDFERIEHVPAAMLNQDTGHGGTFHEPNGGAAARAAVDWLAWQLRGDAEAGRKFTGPACGYCQDGHWTYERKKLD